MFVCVVATNQVVIMQNIKTENTDGSVTLHTPMTLVQILI